MKNKKSLIKNQAGLAHLALPVLVIAVLVVVGSVGYYVYSRNNKSNRQQSQTNSPSTADSIDSIPGDLLTIDKIKELAAAKNSSASITGIELEKENDLLIYLVRLSDGTNLLFNAQTGEEVTGVSVKQDDDSTDNLPANFSLSVSIAQAVDTAKAKNPNGTLKQVEIEVEDGRVVISVKFTDGTKLTVDGGSGSVLEANSNDSGSESSDRSTSSSSRQSSDGSSDDNDDLSSDSGSSNSTSSSDDSNDDKSGGNSGSGSDSNEHEDSSGSNSGSSHDD